MILRWGESSYCWVVLKGSTGRGVCGGSNGGDGDGDGDGGDGGGGDGGGGCWYWYCGGAGNDDGDDADDDTVDDDGDSDKDGGDKEAAIRGVELLEGEYRGDGTLLSLRCG